jgi:Protein of unknown function (DUF2845)
MRHSPKPNPRRIDVASAPLKLALALACAGFAQVTPAVAETLRGGSVLIEPGDDARYVLEKCGEPTSGTTIVDPELARSIPVYQIGITRADRWRYDRAFGQFPAAVTIGDDGRVRDIEFDRVRD